MKRPLKTLIVFLLCVSFVSTFQETHAYEGRRFQDLKSNYTTDPSYFDTIYREIDSSQAISGYEDGTFKPEQFVNRAEFLKMLYASNGITPTKPLNDCFPDVSKDAWFGRYVCKAKEDGLVKGYPDGTYRPQENVNLVQGIKILNEYFKIDYDKEAELWYEDAVKKALEKKLFTPYRTDRSIEREEKYMTFPETLNRAKAFEFIIRYTKADTNELEDFLGVRYYDPLDYNMLAQLGVVAKNLAGHQPNLGSMVYNSEAGLVAFTNTTKSNNGTSITSKVLVADVDKDLNIPSNVREIESITSNSDTPNNPNAVYFSIQGFSPSGYYVHYNASALEYCETFTGNTEDSSKLAWDHVGCPTIRWSPDRKEALFGVAAGFYGGFFQKSIRGDVNNVRDVLDDSLDIKNWIAGYGPPLSLQDYNYIDNDTIIFSIIRSDSAKEIYTIDTDGKKLTRKY